MASPAKELPDARNTSETVLHLFSGWGDQLHLAGLRLGEG